MVTASLAAAMFILLPVAPETPSDSVNCFERIGRLSYPPYEWGAERPQSVIAVIRVEQNGTGQVVSIGGKASDWSSPFALEVGKSIAGSGFNNACSGRVVLAAFQFDLQGERSDVAKVTITKSTQGKILVHAPPPALLCSKVVNSDDDADALHGQAEHLVDTQKFSEAIKCADAAIRWKPVADAYIIKGVAHRKLKQYWEAIAAYNEAEKLDPKNRHIYFNRANSYRDLGQYNRAILDYTTALQNDPELNYAYVNRGNIYLALHRFDLAAQDYSAAIELDPSDTKALNNLGLINIEFRQYDKALENFGKAIQIEPSDGTAFSNRAMTWTLLQKYEQSIRDATEAIRLDGNYFEPRFNRAVAYGLTKRFREAAEDLSAAIRLRPESGESYALRALARKELGDAEAAKSDSEQANKFGTTHTSTWFIRDPLTGVSKPIQ